MLRRGGRDRQGRERLPRRGARGGIYVYDNNSRDRTMEVARRPVRSSGGAAPGQGERGAADVRRRRGRRVRDGRRRATYDAPAPRRWSRSSSTRSRHGGRESGEPRSTRIGRAMLGTPCSRDRRVYLGDHFTDILSGYRMFTRRFVKSFPALSGGFEIETALTVHALELRMPVAESRRPTGPARRLDRANSGGSGRVQDPRADPLLSGTKSRSSSSPGSAEPSR